MAFSEVFFDFFADSFPPSRHFMGFLTSLRGDCWEKKVTYDQTIDMHHLISRYHWP